MSYRFLYYITVFLFSLSMIYPTVIDNGDILWHKFKLYYGNKVTYEIYLAILHGSRSFQIAPEEIAALIKSESDFDPRAVSHAGAIGLCQVMPFNGKDLFNPMSNVYYGAKYYKMCLQLAYGDRKTALRFYNAGPVSRADTYRNWRYVHTIMSDTVRIYAYNHYIQQLLQVR